MKIICTKRGGVLIAADNDARDVLDRIKDGKDVMVDVKQARNIRQHRLFFGMLNLLVDNGNAFDNIEQALTATKIGIGECDPFIDPHTGKTFWTTRSIAFESCDQERFNRIFDRALHLITTRWLIGTTTDELRNEVYALVDGPERSSLGSRAA